MNRTFTVISLHFADFCIYDWVSWFTVKLIPVLPSLTAEMLQIVTLNTDCNAYQVMYVALPKWLKMKMQGHLLWRFFEWWKTSTILSFLLIQSFLCSVEALSSVFKQMTLQRQQEITAVLVDYMKLNHGLGRFFIGDIPHLKTMKFVLMNRINVFNFS